MKLTEIEHLSLFAFFAMIGFALAGTIGIIVGVMIETTLEYLFGVER